MSDPSYPSYDPSQPPYATPPNAGQHHAKPPVFGNSGYTPGRPQPPKKTNTCLIVGLVLGSVFGVGSICICGGIILFAIPHERPLTAQDRAVVVDADDVARFVEFDPSQGQESLEKSEYFDGSYELAYDFEEPSDDGLMISYQLSIERTKQDAENTYGLTWNAIKIATNLTSGGVDLQFEEHNEIFRWGDRSRFVVLKSEGVPFGNVFMAQKDNKIVTFVLVNAYFDDEYIGQLLGPKLAQIDSYSPE